MRARRREDHIERIWFNKYKILNIIGHGGSSDVYLAEHIKLKSLRAIKRIKKDHILHEHSLNEAHILKNLRHPCIPVIYDFEEDQQYSYIIEQFIEGDSLPTFRKQWLGLINEKVIVDITIQICDLLQYLYSLENPILYLDLQPNNIIISNKKVKLIDFGASIYKNQVKSRKYSIGTKGFAAPELYGNKHPSERTDIYGVGALLYYMVTGVSYNQKNSSWDGNKSIKTCSRQLKKIIKTCLNSNPFFRYSNINILKTKLSALNEKKFIKLKKPINTSEPIKIAIAGTQSRIGTTHVSLLITSYLKSNGYTSLYIESNNSGHVHNIIEEYNNVRVKNGIYEVLDCSLLPYYEVELPIDLTKYNFHIIDYGVLNQKNIHDFLAGDIKGCILGAKEWERKHSEEIIKKIGDQENIKYLFNFLESNKYMEVAKELEDIPCYRIPYEPNLYRGQHNNTIHFIEGFLNY